MSVAVTTTPASGSSSQVSPDAYEADVVSPATENSSQEKASYASILTRRPGAYSIQQTSAVKESTSSEATTSTCTSTSRTTTATPDDVQYSEHKESDTTEQNNTGGDGAVQEDAHSTGTKKKKRQGPRKRKRKKKKNDNGSEEEPNLANLLEQRPAATELLQRNILREESVREHMNQSAAQLYQKLQSRPPIESLVKRNLIKGNAHADRTIQARQYMVQRSREMDAVSRSLKNRQSWGELRERGIIKRMSGEQKHEFVDKSQLASFLTSRPSVQTLLQSRVLQDTMMWSELELSSRSSPPSTPPAARNGQSLTLVGRCLYLIGGFGNTDVTCIPHVLDIDQGVWFVPALAPPLSSSPLAVEISNPTFVPAVGTRTCDESNNPISTSTNLPSPHMFERSGTQTAGHGISRGPWPVVLPASRYAHTVGSMGNSLVLFGGYGESKWLNDTWIYDTEKHSWAPAWIESLCSAFESRETKTKRNSAPVCPPARAAHTAVVIDELPHSLHDSTQMAGDNSVFSSMVVFGGNDRNQLFNDVWVLRPCGLPIDPTKEGLSKSDAEVLPSVISPSTYTPMKWIQPKVVGTPPTPRAGHTACLKDGSMFVFGGCEGWGTEPFNDLHVLDVSTLAVRKKGTLTKKSPTDGYTKHERLLMRSDIEATDKLIEDSLSVVWYRPSYTGTPPPPRMGHGAAFTGNNLLVFGGGDARKSFNDLHVLDISVQPMAWSRPCDTGGIPSPRAGLSATSVGTCFVIFGGGTPDGKLYNDLYVLDTDFGFYQSSTGTANGVSWADLQTSLTTSLEDHNEVAGQASVHSTNTCSATYPVAERIKEESGPQDTGTEAKPNRTPPREGEMTVASPHARSSETRRTSFKSATNSTSMLIAALDKRARHFPNSPPSKLTQHFSFRSEDSSAHESLHTLHSHSNLDSPTNTNNVQPMDGSDSRREELFRIREDIVAMQKAEAHQYQELAKQMLDMAYQRQRETDSIIERIDRLLSEESKGDT
eukprot:gb/GECG01007890.1/.p1 GENE.gb/GECG01007890.1/~~gb/GECG01007890.1/.p1  ORF type:complete len:995 (+),score=107.17 gb/GECG01007890.1/:1-2985(+)